MGKEDLVGFCSAPWTDCITYADGALRPCDRNNISFGDWQKDGLKKTWDNGESQKFRLAIREGKYPNEDCASCHNNGTQRTAHSSLVGAFHLHYSSLKAHFNKDIPSLHAIYAILYLKKRNQETDMALANFFQTLENLSGMDSLIQDPHLSMALRKLRVIGESLEDYLQGSLTPRRVATFRQSQLQAKCTARCVMCAGLYTGEIINGPTMDTKFVDEAFAEAEDITDFWCNGAEYLFYKDWKKVALMLAEQGVKLRLSTNGILLTEPTIQFIFDQKILRFLTLSLDAATKETLESTRINVKFEKTMERIRYLLKYAADLEYDFEFTAAFVLMKRNLHELPSFVHLIHSLRPPNCRALVTVLCQPLENFDVGTYREFVHQEHHSLLGERALKQIFEEAHQAQLETGIDISFYNQKLKDFRKQGMPFPKFFPRQSDVDLIKSKLESTLNNGTQIFQNLLENPKQWILRSGQDFGKLKKLLHNYFDSTFFSNGVIQETRNQFPYLDRDIHNYVDKVTEELLIKIQEKKLLRLWGGHRLTLREHQMVPLEMGALIFCPDLRIAGRLIEDFHGHLIFSDGRVIPNTQEYYEVIDGLEAGTLPSPMKLRQIQWVGRFHVLTHRTKQKLFGGRKSLFLWKLSVVYRSVLKALGIRPSSLQEFDPLQVERRES